MAPRRLLSYAGSSLSIACEGGGAEAVVDVLFPWAERAAGLPPGTRQYLLEAGASPGPHRVTRDGQVLYDGFGRGAAADVLLGGVGRDLADQSAGGLLLHAAALVHRGQGILLAGPTGVGKSSLALCMLAQGFEYLSDEMAFVPEGSCRFHPYVRPLTIKKSSRHLLAGCLDLTGPGPSLLASPESDLVPLDRLRCRSSPADSFPLAALIFPRFGPQEEFACVEITAAQAAMELMAALVNARNLPRHGLSEVARLARAPRSFRLRYSGAGQLAGVFEEILDRR